MDLREVGYDDRDWINLAQDRNRWRAYWMGRYEGNGAMMCSGNLVPLTMLTMSRVLQNPDIVLVHYLNVPYPDDNKLAVITPSLALWGDKKEWTKEELVSQLKPMYFLINILPALLENVPCQQRLKMWFAHDGAPAHFLRNVREHLTLTFQDRWIGRGSPTP
ncbi:hypothetical protein ANN_19679 [Periplaneta americana]|uniref:Uncharacterized protein n=1 Tax=Periplaneta americana TaxID=6978 RepID=A0ABQ8SAJ3_PERAM|nr:hypothetical protein ANN_19679 [Periplaneta americana]